MKEQREKVILDAVVRTAVGKQAAGGIRRRGIVPGIVYKNGGEAVSIQVVLKDLTRALHTKAGENVLITLQFDEESKKQLKGRAGLTTGESVVLIKELQHHPLSHEVIHVDFHQISLTKRIAVTVPLSFKGDSPGVKQQGGVLEHLRWDLEVECLPTEIPAEIPVDLSGLALGQTLHIKDLVFPSGVQSKTDMGQPVIACVEPQKEEVPAAAEAAAETVEPEVIKQKKPEEAATGEAPPAGGKEKAKEKPEKEKAEEKKG